MSEATDFLNQAASGKSSSATDYLNQMATEQPATVAPVTTGQRIAQGATDALIAYGQLVEHTPGLNTVASGWRQLIGGAIREAAGEPNAGSRKPGESFNENWLQRVGSSISDDRSMTDEKQSEAYDKIVHDREQDYQAARTAAGQTGIDWWRLGGNAANPINYMAPGGAAATATGRIAQAGAQGGLAMLQNPNADPSHYWWDKSKEVLGGAFAGGATASAIEPMMGLVRAGINKARQVLGPNAANTSAAEAIVNDAYRTRGVDPNTINLNVLSAMKQEAREALASGEDLNNEGSKAAIANRSVASSLPVPIQLMKGQATRDPMLFAKEQNLKGVEGVGEGITARLQQQNQGFIQNLDALGAKDAPDPVQAGNQIAKTVQGYWDSLQAQKTQLYDAVKNSQGQSAWMDVKNTARDIREQMGSATSDKGDWYFLPAPIKDTLAQMESVKLHLNVSQFQILDKKWGEMAAGAADGNTRNAIYNARAMLGEAPLGEEAGQQSMQAYAIAKQAHAHQMSLITPKTLAGRPNPKFQPLMKAVVTDGKAPETLFNSHFMNAAASDAGDNMKFLSSIDPNAPKMLGDTLMGEIKRQALNSATDENGTISQSVLKNWANNPYKSATMKALMPEPQVSTFKALADTAENAKLAPTASVINYSGTAPTLMNMATSAVKSGVASQVVKRVPGLKGIVEAVQEGTAAAKNINAAKDALNPGVTLKSMVTPAKKAATNRTLGRLLVPAAAAYEGSKSSKDTGEDNDNDRQ